MPRMARPGKRRNDASEHGEPTAPRKTKLTKNPAIPAMRILITNDDGVYSPGIVTLANIARQFGDVRVVAPHVEMSSAAHSITAARPLSYKRSEEHTPELQSQSNLVCRL